MKVLMLTPEVVPESSQGFIVSWISKLASKVDALHVIALDDYDRETALPKNVFVYNLGEKKIKITKYLYFSRIMFNLLRKRAVDVVFCHMYVVFTFMVAPWVKPLRIPVVQWYAHGRVDFKLKMANLIADKIVTPSKESFRIESKKVVITGHGIDMEKFRPLERREGRSRKKIVLSVGRISPVKNYETLIEAADILINKKGLDNLEFVIAGGVPIPSQKLYYEKIAKLTEELRLTARLKFVGSIPHTEIVTYYQACDVFVNTSQTGSVDKSVLEAMACQKPALTSNEAFKDILSDNAGLLFFSRENAEELAGKIESLLQMDEGDRTQLGASLREIVDRDHSIDHLTDKLVEIFGAYRGK